MSTSPTRIVELRTENFKRLKAIRIRPEDGAALVEITGRNGQGKSSILDLITSTLGGKKVNPAMPVREGQKAAFGRLELDNGWIVERKWNANGDTAVTITNQEGGKYGTPQDLLNTLFADISFDPLAFTRMEAKQQVAILKQVAGLNFDEIDSLRKGTFDERTDVNREVKQAAAQLAGIPPVEAPDEEENLSELTAEHQAAMDTIMANSKQRDEAERRITKIDSECQTRTDTFAKFDAEIRELEQKLIHAREAQELRRVEHLSLNESAKAEVAGLDAQAAALIDPDASPIAERIKHAEEVNRRVRAKKQRADLEARVSDLQAKSQSLSTKLEELDGKKASMLQAANLPIPGMAMDETGITLNGIPFDQASSAEQLRVSVGMGLALNPKLKVMLVRDGSLLDSAGRQLLSEMAEAAGAQVWMERATDGEAIGVVIEDGEIKGAELEAVAAGEVHVDL